MEDAQRADLLLKLEQNDDGDPIFNWEEIFGNVHPVEIEIGIGKGRFLIEAAQNHSQVNYVGIERAAKYLRLAQARSLRRDLKNIRLVRADAQDFIEFFVPVDSVSAIHLYFPDPWPKSRHKKRRIITTSNVTCFANIMADNGELRFSTDHLEYAKWTLLTMLKHEWFYWTAEKSSDWQNRPEDWPLTRYEYKAFKDNKKPIFLQFKRLPR